MRLQKAFYHASITTMVLIGIMVLYFEYLLLYPFKVMKLNSISAKDVKPGNRAELYVDLCKYRSTYVNMTYSLLKIEDNGQVTLERHIEDTNVSSSSGPTGCYKFIDQTVIIPETALPGRYKILVTLDFEVHKIRHVEYRFDTEFNVI